MKHIQFYVILVLALLLAAAFVFWHYLRSPASKNSATLLATSPSVTAVTTPLQTNKASSQSQISQEQIQQMPSRYTDTNAPEFQKLIAEVRAQSERMVAERSKPIAFYGKVVDEETQAVAGASVHFMWVDPVSTSESDTSSATDGSFSLTGVLGGTVNVDVWKTGYYVVKSLKQFNFDNTGNGSSTENPVLFHLRKKGSGADLISTALNVKIPRDGSPISVDFFNRDSGASGQLKLSQIKPPYESWKKATEWSFRMTIPDGGFVEENDEFPFEAAENGFRPAVEFDFKVDQPNWKTRFTKNYYIVFGNPPRYGNLTVQTDIMWDGARVSYTINPDGSRYLEPKP